MPLRKNSYTYIAAGVHFTQAEFSLLYATKVSENAQTLQALADHARRSRKEASRAINGLIRKGTLRPIESYDDMTLFGFQENDVAQAVYCEIYQVSPIE